MVHNTASQLAKILTVVGVLLLIGSGAMAAPPRPPSQVTAVDLPNDDGTGLLIQWTLSPDDSQDGQPRAVGQYNVERKTTTDPNAEFELIGEANFGETDLEDNNCERGVEYR
ncbi:MAG: hypothetical protein ABGZ17_30025, partial [Planctomycetaceae bacterium]